jgi:hypothetical protein
VPGPGSPAASPGAPGTSRSEPECAVSIGAAASGPPISPAPPSPPGPAGSSTPMTAPIPPPAAAATRPRFGAATRQAPGPAGHRTSGGCHPGACSACHRDHPPDRRSAARRGGLDAWLSQHHHDGRAAPAVTLWHRENPGRPRSACTQSAGSRPEPGLSGGRMASRSPPAQPEADAVTELKLTTAGPSGGRHPLSFCNRISCEQARRYGVG